MGLLWHLFCVIREVFLIGMSSGGCQPFSRLSFTTNQSSGHSFFFFFRTQPRFGPCMSPYYYPRQVRVCVLVAVSPITLIHPIVCPWFLFPNHSWSTKRGFISWTCAIIIRSPIKSNKDFGWIPSQVQFERCPGPIHGNQSICPVGASMTKTDSFFFLSVESDV